jgi:hypothetical protein
MSSFDIIVDIIHVYGIITGEQFFIIHISETQEV